MNIPNVFWGDLKHLLSGLGETLASLAGNNLPKRTSRIRQGCIEFITQFKKIFKFPEAPRKFWPAAERDKFCPFFPNSPFNFFTLTPAIAGQAFNLFSTLTFILFTLTFNLSNLTFLPAQQRYEFSHPQMGTVFRLVFYTEKDAASAQNIADQVFERVDTLNAIFSDYLPESELNRLSDQAGNGKKFKVSEPLWDILRLSKKYAKASKGAFDPTIGALTRLWRRARHLKEAPDSARIAAALKTVDYRSICFFKNRRIQLKIKGTRLDLGGIAQGYAADECLSMLQKAGVFAALVDAGGDIALGDAPPGAEGWTIERPGTDSTTETLILSHCGITTSGGTYRYFEDAKGVRFSHIVDPRTGWGITQHHLVTVQAPDAVTADAWATALSVTGKSSRRTHLKIW